MRSGPSLSSAPLCDIPSNVVIRVEAVGSDGGKDRARVAEPERYRGWCSLSERLVTFVGGARPAEMDKEGGGNSRGGVQPFYEIDGSGRAILDGRYVQHHLQGYRGAMAYKKIGTAMTLYRWRQKMWILADLGPTLSKFGEPHALYTVPCGKPPQATPVTSEPWTRVCGDGDLPPTIVVRGPIIAVEEESSASDGAASSDDDKAKSRRAGDAKAPKPGSDAPPLPPTSPQTKAPASQAARGEKAARPPPLAAPRRGAAAASDGDSGRRDADPRSCGLDTEAIAKAFAGGSPHGDDDEPVSPSFVMVSPPASPSRTDFEVVDKAQFDSASRPFGNADDDSPTEKSGRCHVQ